MFSFSAAMAAAFVGGAVIGGFLGALYGMSVVLAQRPAAAARRRWRRGRVKTVPPPMSRTMPLRRG